MVVECPAWPCRNQLPFSTRPLNVPLRGISSQVVVLGNGCISFGDRCHPVVFNPHQCTDCINVFRNHILLLVNRLEMIERVALKFYTIFPYEDFMQVSPLPANITGKFHDLSSGGDTGLRTVHNDQSRTV